MTDYGWKFYLSNDNLLMLVRKFEYAYAHASMMRTNALSFQEWPSAIDNIAISNVTASNEPYDTHKRIRHLPYTVYMILYCHVCIAKSVK